MNDNLEQYIIDHKPLFDTDYQADPLWNKIAFKLEKKTAVKALKFTVLIRYRSINQPANAQYFYLYLS